jgi:hypothetical protein
MVMGLVLYGLEGVRGFIIGIAWLSVAVLQGEKRDGKSRWGLGKGLRNKNKIDTFKTYKMQFAL